VPDDFGAPNGMGTKGMISNGGVYGDRTLSQVFPGYQSSVFVKMAKIIQDAEDAIYAHSWGSGGSGGYHNYIDIDAFIDWQIGIEMSCNWEIGQLNGHYMHYDPKIGKLKMGPLWDLDNGWDVNQSTSMVRNSPFWYKEILGGEKDSYYVQRFKDRWATVKNKFNTELDPYIDATNARFQRITGYNHPIGIGGNRDGYKWTLTERSNRLDSTFNGF
jgi:hypothetical protein